MELMPGYQVGGVGGGGQLGHAICAQSGWSVFIRDIFYLERVLLPTWGKKMPKAFDVLLASTACVMASPDACNPGSIRTPPWAAPR
jgi:hypothetical protein